jgi:hypothetical protein
MCPCVLTLSIAVYSCEIRTDVANKTVSESVVATDVNRIEQGQDEVTAETWVSLTTVNFFNN